MNFNIHAKLKIYIEESTPAVFKPFKKGSEYITIFLIIWSVSANKHTVVYKDDQYSYDRKAIKSKHREIGLEHHMVQFTDSLKGTSRH